MSNGCMTCKFAEWSKTAAGRLHPSGDGRCTFKWVLPPLPKSRYFHTGDPRPSGGMIERRKPYEDCPTFELKE